MAKDLRKKPNPSKLLLTALRPKASRRPASTGPMVGDLRLREAAQDAKRLREYQEICGYSPSDIVPATWLHVQSFPLQTELMSGSDWPFPALGTVHVSNSMKMIRPVRVDETLDIEVRASHLDPHEKGTVFHLLGFIRVGEELVWSSHSTYLVPGYRVPGANVEIPREEMPELGDDATTWELPADLGRSYARVSGDFNPIHLAPATAKMFGFKTTIVHGMWTHARALAAMEKDLPESYEARVQFAKPIELPSTVRFASDGQRYGVVGEDEKVRIAGSVLPIETTLMGRPLTNTF